MPRHDWAEKDFDFGELEMAARYATRLYKRITHEVPIYKEKYGTIRYEFTSFWLHSKEHVELFSRILKRTIKKYPAYAGELVEDWVVSIDHPYWKPYFEGVLWGSCNEEWRKF